MYNTVDASLLFINALWEYLHVTEKECDPSLKQKYQNSRVDHQLV